MDKLNTRIVVEMPEALKKRFKIACIHQSSEMSEEIRKFIESWTERVESEEKGLSKKGKK